MVHTILCVTSLWVVTQAKWTRLGSQCSEAVLNGNECQGWPCRVEWLHSILAVSAH